MSRLLSQFLAFVICALSVSPGDAQVVAVSLQLETNTLAVGSTTRLHVYAQIVADKRPTSDRIFSWYLDLLNSNANVAQGSYETLQKPTSDRDPATSSTGTTSGADRRGIYDTFINLAGAGRDAPVELFSVPIQGLVPGRTTFRIQAGTGAPNLSHDFIVAPNGGGDPLVGGIYTVSTVDLEVVDAGNQSRLSIAATPLSGGQTRLNLSYSLVAGRNHFVEFRDNLAPGTSWQTLAGGPHNQGTISETNTIRQRFYRLRVQQ